MKLTNCLLYQLKTYFRDIQVMDESTLHAYSKLSPVNWGIGGFSLRISRWLSRYYHDWFLHKIDSTPYFEDPASDLIDKNTIDNSHRICEALRSYSLSKSQKYDVKKHCLPIIRKSLYLIRQIPKSKNQANEICTLINC